MSQKTVLLLNYITHHKYYQYNRHTHISELLPIYYYGKN